MATIIELKGQGVRSYLQAAGGGVARFSGWGLALKGLKIWLRMMPKATQLRIIEE